MALGEALNLVEILYLARRKQFLDRVNALQNSQNFASQNLLQSTETQEISENEICKLEPDEREEIEVRNLTKNVTLISYKSLRLRFRN